MTLPGTIPQSNALAEASPESISDLLSRDPEHYTPDDWTRVIGTYREQRERWAKAEAAGSKSLPKQPKAPQLAGPAPVVPGSPDDL